MTIIIRRSTLGITTAESEDSLATSIEAGDIHAVLYAHGEVELAGRLVAHLGAQEAVDVAARLKRVVRRGGRSGLFRDYRTTLSPSDAARIGLVAAWYERAGHAGCRVWADLREGAAPVQAPPESAPSFSDQGMRPQAGDTVAMRGLMPEWLAAPAGSIWADEPVSKP